MTDRPILFSAPMVRALLDGRKTQTRRVLTPQPYDFPHPDDGHRCWNASGVVGGRICISDRALLDLHRKPQPGDRLYVREAHHRTNDSADSHLVGYDFADGPVPCEGRYYIEGVGDVQFFRHSLGGWGGRTSRNYPAMHMPKWASRLTLIVTEVRVERLQEISEADASAEGLISWEYTDCDGDPRLDGSPYEDTGWHWQPQSDEFAGFPTAVGAFRNLWDSLNAERGFGWEANPWVVAVTFTVRRGNIDQVKP